MHHKVIQISHSNLELTGLMILIFPDRTILGDIVQGGPTLLLKSRASVTRFPYPKIIRSDSLKSRLGLGRSTSKVGSNCLKAYANYEIQSYTKYVPPNITHYKSQSHDSHSRSMIPKLTKI